jgi:DDE family transposase
LALIDDRFVGPTFEKTRRSFEVRGPELYAKALEVSIKTCSGRRGVLKHWVERKRGFSTRYQRGAIPYIPFKTNSVPAFSRQYGSKSEVWTRMFHFYNEHREEFLTHYHKRSNIETTFHMIKAKFGQRLRSKTLTAQINEALCKVLCHNLCVVIQSVHELGIETNFSTEEAA